MKIVILYVIFSPLFIVKLFTSRCNPAFRDFEGKNSLLIAAEKGHVDIVHELLRIGEKEKKKEK